MTRGSHAVAHRGARRGAGRRGRCAGFGVDVAVHAQRRAHLAAVRGGPQPGRSRRRHPPRADGDVRRRGLRQADPPPGLAALTAGPGITNGVSAVTSARFNGSPLVVLGGRAPQAPLGRRVAAGARPRADPGVDHEVGGDRQRPDQGRRDGPRRHRPRRRRRTAGPVFLDFPLDVFGPSAGDVPAVDPALTPAAAPDPDAVGRARGARRRRRAAGVHRRQRRLLGRRVGRAACRRRAPAGARVHQRPRPRARCRPTTSWRSCARAALLKTARRRRRRARHAARLPARLRPLRRRHGRPRRRRDVAARRPRRRARPSAGDLAADLARRSPSTAGGAPTTRRGSPSCATPRTRRGRARTPLLAAAGDPIKPTPDLRRAAQAARPRRRRDLRRRRLRVLRRQVRRGVRARLLARHRPVRLPRQRDGLRDRGPGRAARRARSSCCSATAPPGSA